MLIPNKSWLLLKFLLLPLLVSDSASNSGDGPTCGEKDCLNGKNELKFKQYNVCEYLLTPVSREVPHQLYSSGGMKEYLCDTQTDGGRWMIIESRKNRDTNFKRNWKDYKNGFGSCESDYYLGNEFIHQITSQENHKLRVEIKFRGTPYLVEYGRFKLGSEEEGYVLFLENFIEESSNVHDALSQHNGTKFSTDDVDNDDIPNYSCANVYKSGWWFRGCFTANLHAPFAAFVSDAKHGLFWTRLTSSYESLMEVQLKIRSTER